MKVNTAVRAASLLLGLSLISTGYAWNEAGGEKDEAMHLKPDRKRGIAVFEVCSACHLTEGWGQQDGTFPQLAGQLREGAVLLSPAFRQVTGGTDLEHRDPTLTVGLEVHSLVFLTASLVPGITRRDQGQAEQERGSSNCCIYFHDRFSKTTS